MDFYKDTKVDTSRLILYPGFDGVEDMVLIDKETRTCFGKFVAFFERETKLWSIPLREDIEAADTVGLDPFFGAASEEAAKISRELGKPYITIDCKYDSLLHQLSSVNVISNEFIRGNYPDEDVDELFVHYTDNTDGLVVFTFGSKKIIFGRRDDTVHTMTPFSVHVVSTLGAGDTFKAGAIYALNQKMSDEDLVRFAAATAGVACESYPIAYNPPTLKKVNALLSRESTNN
jgi:sugar/nucleoside kinase (ribokinase family)